ncbi:CrcB family protein [Schaalia sp. ZJ1691]|uniref:fluoride efflux transporter FluC n=1 Tax=Schaalia sp. ZJ1691 TaxID=2709404 RepID=UPI001F1519C3|nr:CrcB family protein [Schaalia sp. ZJ1691]
MNAVIAWIILPFAGGLGAVCRWKLDTAVKTFALKRREDHSLAPYLGIIVVNVFGCFLAGFTGVVLASSLPLGLVISTGFLGGFTTFSTAVMDVWTLWKNGKILPGVVLGLGTWGLSLVAALLGIHAAVIMGFGG